MGKSNKTKYDPVIVAGVFLIIIALTLFIFNEVFKLQSFQQWYGQYEDILAKVQNDISHMHNAWIILLVVFALYVVKGLLPFPLFPVSFICVLTSLVYTSVHSVEIGLIGLVILFSVRYLSGLWFGGGLTKKFLTRFKPVWHIIEHSGKGNPWVLVVCRFIPVFPVNAVSTLYGSMKFNYFYYLFLSVLGYLPKLISYTIIGRNAFNPLSSGFILPIAILLFLSGSSMIGINRLIEYISRKSNK